MKVWLPSQLHGYTGGRSEVEATGRTVSEALFDLDGQFPGIRFRVIDEQNHLRRHILLFVGEEREEDLGREIPPGKGIFIVGALSGG